MAGRMLLALVAGLDVCIGARKRNENALLNRFREMREDKQVMVDKDDIENVNDVENDGPAFVGNGEDDNDREDALSLQQESEIEKAIVSQVTTNAAEVSGDFTVFGAGNHEANGRYINLDNGKCKFSRPSLGYVPTWILSCPVVANSKLYYNSYYCSEASPNNCCGWQVGNDNNRSKAPAPRFSPSSCRSPTPRRRFCLGGCR